MPRSFDHLDPILDVVPVPSEFEYPRVVLRDPQVKNCRKRTPVVIVLNEQVEKGFALLRFVHHSPFRFAFGTKGLRCSSSIMARASEIFSIILSISSFEVMRRRII